MFLAFQDANGEYGTISEELSVDYDGEWQEDVETVVLEVTARSRGSDDDVETSAVFNELVVELPEETPVQSIERRGERDRPR